MSKFNIVSSNQFKKDMKRFLRSPKDKSAILKIVIILENMGVEGIPQNMKPHKLIGNYKGMWECHIKPNLLLIWEQEDEPINEISLVRVGSHSELF
jgi:mRNA interferase YafQ